jgi:hypothetical protein
MYEILGLYDDKLCKKLSSFVTLLLLLWKLFSSWQKDVIIIEKYKIDIRGADFRGEKGMEQLSSNGMY